MNRYRSTHLDYPLYFLRVELQMVSGIQQLNHVKKLRPVLTGTNHQLIHTAVLILYLSPSIHPSIYRSSISINSHSFDHCQHHNGSTTWPSELSSTDFLLGVCRIYWRDDHLVHRPHYNHISFRSEITSSIERNE